MYDFYDAVERKYNIDYSYGGEVERSFWKRVGNIVNKKAIFNQEQKVFDKILKSGNNFIEGKKGKKNK